MTDHEHDHDHHHHGGGPGLGIVLLIPAAVILAKAASRHRRAMWGSAWGPSGPGSQGMGHHGPFGAGDAEGSFRLPPKIEWMLDTWHKRAHEQDQQPTEPESAS